jgi:hypothetical protein
VLSRTGGGGEAAHRPPRRSVPRRPGPGDVGGDGRDFDDVPAGAVVEVRGVPAGGRLRA